MAVDVGGEVGGAAVEADPLIATSMLVGTVTAVWRGGLEADPDDLAERIWVALRTE